MGEVLENVRTWWYRFRHPGTCHICGQPLPDNVTTGVCETPDCQDADEDSKQW